MARSKMWVCIVALACSAVAISAAQDGATSVLTGKVTSADGRAMEGVAVSLRATNKAFTTTVFTNHNGQYSVPLLDPGQYQVWAQAVGFEAGTAELALGTGKPAAKNFSLNPLANYDSQLSGDELLASLPGGSVPDLRMKQILANNCTGCHQSNYPLQNRFDVNGWTAVINFMSKTDPFGGVRNPQASGNPLYQAYKEELAAYLGRVRGQSSTLEYKTVPRPTGDATEVVVTEFDVPMPGRQGIDPAESHGRIWSDGEPSSYGGFAPHDAVVAKNGYVWFTDQISPDRTLGRLDPKTGDITPYNLADENGTSVHAHGLAIDANGDIWLNNIKEGTFAKFDPNTGQFTRFPRPSDLPGVGGTVVVDIKGRVWAETREGTIRLDPSTGKYTAYKASTPGGTYGMATDRNGNGWFTQPGLNRITRVDASTGELSEVTVPNLEDLANSHDRELASTMQQGANAATPLVKAPRRMAADMNSDYLWVAEYDSDGLARVDIKTNKVKEYQLPHAYSRPYATAVDKNHMVWIALMNTDRVAKFDPSTEKFTEYLLPSRGSEARFITVDNNTTPPTVWVPYFRGSKLARLQFLNSAPAKMAAAK